MTKTLAGEGADVQLPTADEEMWRYSRIAELDLGRYTWQPHTAAAATGSTGAPAGVTVAGGHGFVTYVDDAVEALDGLDPDVFAQLNREHASTVHVRVPAKTTVADAVIVTHDIAPGGAAVAPRLVIEAGADSEVTVIELFRGGAGSLTIPVLQINAAAAARVNYLAVNELDSTAWSISHQLAVGDRDSSTLLATVALGGDYARVRTEARLVGAGGSTRQIALYFADGTQMHDFRTIQDHIAPHTTSELLFKGAVQDTSRSVYTGMISIGEHARGTNATQTNRTLTLSEGAWAESVPNLDIRTNDVKCSHASTVGPVDEEQRFYLESRGVRPEVAERLVVLGFFDEVFERLPTDTASELVDGLRQRVAAKLDVASADTGVTS